MTGQDLDPRLSNAMRRAILHYARKNPKAATSRLQVATVLGSSALLAGFTAAVVAIIVTGIPSHVPPPPAAHTETPISTPSPSVTLTPSPTPTPSEPLVDSTDTSTWSIDFTGVGPVTLGSSFEEQRALLPTFADMTDPLCVSANLVLEAPSGLFLLFVGGTEQPGTTAAITFHGTGEAPFELDDTRTPRTEAGIGINSTKEELFAAYPDIELTGIYGTSFPFYGITDGNGGWIVFQLFNDRVGAIQVANEAALPLENGSVKTMPSERCPA